MLWAYFDESGKFQNTDFVCIAGYVSDDPGWESFTKLWGEMLRRHGVSAVHMKDLVALQGEYKDLGWTHTEKDKLIDEAISLIKAKALAGFGVAVNTKYWRSMSPEARKRIGDPHMLCFQRIIKLVIKNLTKAGITYPIAAIFDDSEEYGVRCYRMMSQLRREVPEVKERIGSISFADDQIYYPLQAADMIAYESAKELRQKAEGYKSRSSFSTLVTPDGSSAPLEYDSEYYDGEALEECDQLILSRGSGK